MPVGPHKVAPLVLLVICLQLVRYPCGIAASDRSTCSAPDGTCDAAAIDSLEDVVAAASLRDYIRLSAAYGKKISALGDTPAGKHDQARLLVNRAHCKRQKQLQQAALKDLDRAVRLDSSFLKAHVRRAQLLLEMGSKKEAELSVQQATALLGPTTDVELLLDLAQAQAGISGQAELASRAAAPAGAGAADSQAIDAAAQMAVSQAISMINTGRLQEAVKLMDELLAASPHQLGALLARGSAKALLRQLPEAIKDLTAAVEVEPRFADAWRRRGQARAAAGDAEGALSDIRHCQSLLPLMGSDEKELSQRRAELQAEAATLLHRLGDYQAAVVELEQSLAVIKDNAQAWHLLGVCHAVMGHIPEALAAYNTTLELLPRSPDVWLNVARALKGAGRMRESEEALLRALEVDGQGRPKDNRSAQAMLLRAQLYFYSGLHPTAVEYGHLATVHVDEGGQVEPLLLSATSLHTFGLYQEAVSDYEACMSKKADPGNRDQQVYQLLAWYQRMTAMYAALVLDQPAAATSADCDLPADLREGWCKKSTPTEVMLERFVPDPPKLDGPPAQLVVEEVDELTRRADQIGALLQYTHTGFSSNRRQQRAAGFAAIELAQTVQQVVQLRRSGQALQVDDKGSTGHCGTSGRHAFGWRDAMDLVVKWRQVVEPGDAVLWVDLLPSSSFLEGFGSHTRMLGGQGKDIRYHSNAAAALQLHKRLLLAEPHSGYDVTDEPLIIGPEDREALEEVNSVAGLWQALGEDSWAVVPLTSVYRAHHSLEGTRLTLVRQHNGYEYSIRTPNTPTRWQDFDTELSLAWEEVLEAMSEGSNRTRVADSVLTFGYFWYNLMPLARGTAGAGYTSVLSLLMAAGYDPQARIPANYQVDWEAILAPTYQQFWASVSSWMMPELLPMTAARDLARLPLVSEVLRTPRQRIQALNRMEQMSL